MVIIFLKLVFDRRQSESSCSITHDMTCRESTMRYTFHFLRSPACIAPIFHFLICYYKDETYFKRQKMEACEYMGIEVSHLKLIKELWRAEIRLSATRWVSHLKLLNHLIVLFTSIVVMVA